MQITNYVVAQGRPTLVNLGDGRFQDIHSDEATVIHELTHVCQIAHTYRFITDDVRTGRS